MGAGAFREHSRGTGEGAIATIDERREQAPGQDRFSACILCGARDLNYWFRPPRASGPIVQCKRCGLVYAGRIEDNRAIIFDQAVLGTYPSDWLSSSDLGLLSQCWELPLIEAANSELPGKLANANHFLDVIERECPSRGHLLDLGAFCGIFLRAAQQRGWQVVGLEPLVGPSIYARGNFGIRVITDVLRDSTFPAESFDVVTAFQVFEHLPNPLQVLEIVHRILKPGGLVVIEVPNVSHWSVRLLGRYHRHFVQDHLYFFSPESLRRLLSRCHFEDVRVNPSRRSLSWAALVEWLPRLVPINHSDGHWIGRRSWLRRQVVTFKTGEIISGYAVKSNRFEKANG